jgi:hypothetical protein
MAQYREQQITAKAAAEELRISPRRFRQLYRTYLLAASRGEEADWIPGHSGGNRQRVLPPEVEAFWRQLFTATPPGSFSLAASEALRRFQVSVDRATVRRWVHAQQLDLPKIPRKDRAPVRRWQCARVGTLWQLDVTPHRWFGPHIPNLPLYDMLDDCSRVITGARIYERETLLGYLDFLSRSFEVYGLPLALYVDYHSFFFSQIPDRLTCLGEALRFYGISLKYAPTPQAKGKVERLHQLWQNRIPSLLCMEAIRTIPEANKLIEELRVHRNRVEVHRELNRPAQDAWNIAIEEGRSDLRPKPRCPWWEHIWSVQVWVKIDIDGTVPAGSQRFRIRSLPPRTKLLRCEHRDGSFSFLLKPPRQGARPLVILRIEASAAS